MLIFALVTACAADEGRGPEFSSLQAGAKSVCEVMADPGPYVGRRIVIKGIYFQEPHQRLLYDEACPQWDFRVGHSSGGSDPGAEAIVRRMSRNDRRVRVPVVYSGVVTANEELAGCTKPGCSRYSLEQSHLLAALPQRQMPAGK